MPGPLISVDHIIYACIAYQINPAMAVPAASSYLVILRSILLLSIIYERALVIYLTVSDEGTTRY
jgi:hypothetical protein